MREAAEIEVGTQFPVQANEHVAVEGRGDAERVVVGQQQLGLRLHEVGADQHRTALSLGRPHRLQQPVGIGAVEVADVRPQKDDERLAN